MLGDESAARQIAHKVFVDRHVLKVKSSTSLASGSSATASWYLIERACFSEISAFRDRRQAPRLVLALEAPRPAFVVGVLIP